MNVGEFQSCRKRPRLFVDMDGTLAEWRNLSFVVKNDDSDAIEKSVESMLQDALYRPGYFKSLMPHTNVVEAVNKLCESGDVEVFVCSCVLPDKGELSPRRDKEEWLNRFLPCVDKRHRIFVPDGENKADHIPGGVCKSDFLLDDYTENLNRWSKVGSGIKVFNNVNSTKSSWNGPAVSYAESPTEIAKAILNIIKFKENVRHDQPERSAPQVKLYFYGDVFKGEPIEEVVKKLWLVPKSERNAEILQFVFDSIVEELGASEMKTSSEKCLTAAKEKINAELLEVRLSLQKGELVR